ncbi:MAG: hypothetical protein KatS3mg115_1873 [Candidatus Poribacteria bacterium]|nr:MAG: hypothetical protein KatS3mg115_1873 [Candidatus Poribacteria bacterium]
MSSESGSGPVRIGLVGCGGISRAHARGLRALGPEWAKVVLCCDLDPDRARLRAEELDAEAFTTDWDEVFDHPEIEAVDLCLPHHLHAEAAIAAAQAGKHILIEKPLARTLEEADRILNAVQRSGVLLMVAFVERFEADHQRAKELLDAGAIGRPMLVRVDHNQNLLLPPDSWIRSAELLGGGALASAGCHRLDLLRWWLGEVDSVFAWTLHEPSRMEGGDRSGSDVALPLGGDRELCDQLDVLRSTLAQTLLDRGHQGIAPQLRRTPASPERPGRNGTNRDRSARPVR